MTNPNIITIDLTALNLKSLQSLAKEFKVKNWWTMKKADLLKALETIQAVEKKALEEKVYQDEEISAQDQDQGKAPKAKKEKKAKKAKKEKVEKNEENLVTLKELASEYNMKGTKARRLLRDSTVTRPYGGNRWEWDKDTHQKELAEARELLKAHAGKKEK